MGAAPARRTEILAKSSETFNSFRRSARTVDEAHEDGDDAIRRHHRAKEAILRLSRTRIPPRTSNETRLRMRDFRRAFAMFSCRPSRPRRPSPPCARRCWRTAARNKGGARAGHDGFRRLRSRASRPPPPRASVCVSVPAAAASFAFAFVPRGAFPGLPLGLASPPERHSLSAASNSRRFASSSNSPSNNDGVSFTTRAPPVVRRSARPPTRQSSNDRRADDDDTPSVKTSASPRRSCSHSGATYNISTSSSSSSAKTSVVVVAVVKTSVVVVRRRFRSDGDDRIAHGLDEVTPVVVEVRHDACADWSGGGRSRARRGGAGAGGYPRLGLPSGAPSRMTTCSTRGEAGREPPRGAEPGRRDADADVGRVRRFAWDRRTAEGVGSGLDEARGTGCGGLKRQIQRLEASSGTWRRARPAAAAARTAARSTSAARSLAR